MSADQPTPEEAQVAQELPGDLPPAPEPGTPVYPAQEGVTGGEGGGDAGRFGVYDDRLQRFRGGVYGNRKDARKAAKAMGVTSPEIRPL